MLLLQSQGILHAWHVSDDKQGPCMFWGLFPPLLEKKKNGEMEKKKKGEVSQEW